MTVTARNPAVPDRGLALDRCPSGPSQLSYCNISGEGCPAVGVADVLICLARFR